MERGRVGLAARERVLAQEAPVAGIVVPGAQEVQARGVQCLPVELIRVRRGPQPVRRVAEGVVGVESDWSTAPVALFQHGNVGPHCTDEAKTVRLPRWLCDSACADLGEPKISTATLFHYLLEP